MTTRLRYAFAVCTLLIVSSCPANPQGGPIAARTALEDQSAQSPDSEGMYEAKAKKLAGYVHIATQKNTALAMVLVQELDASWNHVLGSTRTDYQGYFKLKPARKGKRHNLRLSAQGFSTREYEVTLTGGAPSQLMLEMQLPSKSQDGSAKPVQARSFIALAPGPQLNGPV